MSNMNRVIHNMKENELNTFFNVRAAMRRAYLTSIVATVGIHKYCVEDDNFMDAIDVKTEMLMYRAGMSTPNADNRNAAGMPEDVFARVLRPNVMTREQGQKLEDEIKSTVEALVPETAKGWGTPMPAMASMAPNSIGAVSGDSVN